METNRRDLRNPLSGTALVIVHSCHHHNTEKVAHVIADVLGAEVKTPHQVNPEDIKTCPLIGFGSGIYGGTVHASLLDLADTLEAGRSNNVFLFSTYGAPAAVANREFVEKNHEQLREKLREKGYTVIGEFSCAGWNTNSFLNYFGGINKGRPNADDLKNAREFARDLNERTRNLRVP